MNAIKLNLIDYEVVKELRKIDGKLVILGLSMTLFLWDNMIFNKRIEKLEKQVDDLSIKHYNLAKEKSKED